MENKGSNANVLELLARAINTFTIRATNARLVEVDLGENGTCHDRKGGLRVESNVERKAQARLLDRLIRNFRVQTDGFGDLAIIELVSAPCDASMAVRRPGPATWGIGVNLTCLAIAGLMGGAPAVVRAAPLLTNYRDWNVVPHMVSGHVALAGDGDLVQIRFCPQWAKPQTNVRQ